MENKRKPLHPAHIWIPIILATLLATILSIIKISTKNNTAWTTIALWFIGVLIFTGLISLIIYFFADYKDNIGKEREYNSEERCLEIIKEKLMNTYFENIFPFTKITYSIHSVEDRGSNKFPKTKIMTTIVKTKGVIPKYKLIGIRMQKGMEDYWTVKQRPMNFKDEDLISNLRETIIRGLCEYPETIGTDRITMQTPTGITTTETTKDLEPIKDEEED